MSATGNRIFDMFALCLLIAIGRPFAASPPDTAVGPSIWFPSGSDAHLLPITTPFTWAPSVHDTVQIQVSWRESDFSAIVIDTVVTGTSAVLDLGFYKTYYWRARYVLGQGFSVWSATLTFATDVEPRSIPFLQSPDDNAAGLSDSVVLIWTDPNNVMHMPDGSPGPWISYTVQVSADSTFPLRSPAEVSFGRFGDTRVARPPYYFNRVIVSRKSDTLLFLPFDTRFFWRVNVLGNPKHPAEAPGILHRENSEWTPTRSFRTMKKPPVSFAVTYPANGAADVESTLTVRWHDTLSDSSDGFGYHIEMRSDSNFNRLDSAYNAYLGPPGSAPRWIHAYTLEDSVAVILPAGSKVYWNLWKNAPNLVRVSNFAEGSFTTAPAIPDVAVPGYPEDAATDVEPDPVLSWATAPRASRYQVLVSVDSTFADPLRRDTVNGTEFREEPLSPGATYWWKVKAINGNGESGYSTARTFTTTLTPSSVISLTSLEKAWRAFSFGRDGTVTYELADRTHVSLRIYDIQGRLAGAPIDAMQDKGRHTEVLSPLRRLEPGWYYLTFRAGGFHRQARFLKTR